MAGFMNRINRNDIKHSNLAFLTTFEWELVITKLPPAIYYPSDDVIQVRLKSVSGLPNYENEVQETNIRGFKLIQSGLTNNGSVDITFTFADFEDQSIEAFFQDYIYKSNDPFTRKSLHRRDLMMDCELYRLNVNREPVSKWILEGGLPTSADIKDEFTSEMTLIDEKTLSVKFEYVEKILLNF
jgi:hypothetical protein